MSSYRDDTHELAVAADATWGGLSMLTDEVARASAAAFFSMMVVHTGAAAASDEVIERWRHTTAENAQVADVVLDNLQASRLVVERGRLTDRSFHHLAAVVAESALLSDVAFDRLTTVTAESATASDTVIGLRYSTTLIADNARAEDLSFWAASDLVVEVAASAILPVGVLKGMDAVAESATVADSVLDAHSTAVAVSQAAATAADWVIDRLLARDVVNELAVADGLVLSLGVLPGQAWTANADNWAMSRYSDFAFTSLAVIDGVLYGCAPDGVYALNSTAEAVSGEIRTGRLDLGDGHLVHPVQAVIEYELDGSAQMDVITTQGGEQSTYTYELPAQAAEELTSGRFVFGRGLRGRHFSFALRMTGMKGYINDLSVQATPTKRRV